MDNKDINIVEILPSTRYCFIPSCPNNSKKERNMVFVPVKSTLKEDWCRLVGRNCPKRRLYCCEMHLDLERDLENFREWSEDSAYPVMSSMATLKWGQALVSVTTEAVPCLPSTSSASDAPFSQIQTTKAMYDKIILVKPETQDIGTNYRARIMPKKNLKRKLEPGDTTTTAVDTAGSSHECLSQETTSHEQVSQQFPGRQFNISIVEKNPLMYIGIPKHFYFIIDTIVEEYKKKTCPLNIIITLYKLRQGDTLVRLSHHFQISRSKIQKIFYETTILLSSYFQNFIFYPSLIEIKRNLPYAFKIRYSKVQMIIDCFEIGIEKPSNPVRQAQTWSAYKSCNTVKYLVGATPCGLITFISKGYNGRISDKAITIESGLIDVLPTNAVIMADRGFKEIESLLAVKNIKLLKPPSVYSNVKPTKEQVMESKVIASLRIHIERVIRRLREFRILKPHSVINHKHVGYLDEYVTIACGLSNLQNKIIKSQ